MTRAIPLFLVIFTGCDLLGGKDSGWSTDPAWTPDGGSWQAWTHPCVGNRTDAMWWDDRQTVYVGCGSTTVGYGLYRSTDGGGTWSSVADERLSGFRVSSIQRADDGLLYVAGIDTLGSDRVVSLDGADAVSVVYQAGSQAWSSFHVGTFRRAPSGDAVAESLTGTGLVYRNDDADAFGDGSGWPTDGGGYQILDLEFQGDRFFGAGSTISQPPTVFLHDGTSPFRMRPMALADWSGELWSIDVRPSGIAVGGVNQDTNVGAVFTADTLTPAASDWRELSIDSLVGDRPSWIRGVCMEGGQVAAVGEFSQIDAPILLLSADLGQTWTDATASLPEGTRALHQCMLWPDGRLAVAGKDGVLAVWTPGG